MPVDGILVNSGNLQKPYELEIRVTIVFSLIDISAKFEITTFWGLSNDTILKWVMRTIFLLKCLYLCAMILWLFYLFVIYVNKKVIK